MKRVHLLLILGLVIIAIFIGQSLAFAQVQVLSLRDLGPGSSYYFIYGGLAKIINKNVPGVKVVLETTSGSIENARLISRGRVSMGLVNTFNLMDAYLGKKPFGEEEKGGIRAMLGSLFTAHSWVTLDPTIKTIKDLKNKKVGFGKAGSAGATQVIPFQLQCAGISVKDVKPFYIDYNDEVEALRDGHIDAFWAATLVPEATLLDLTSSHKVYFMEFGPGVREKIMEEFQGGGVYLPITIKAGTYKNLAKDYHTLGTGLPLCAHKDVDERILYQITKAIIEHVDELIAIHKAGEFFNGKNATMGIPKGVPFHPGAEKYLREKGFIKEN